MQNSPQEERTRINSQIRAREVRVIDDDGSQLGIMPLQEAMRICEDKGLDLVEVASTSRPPVCRVMDYGKYKYNQKKKQQGAKRKQTGQQMKEVKLRPKTEEHDYMFKLKHIMRFLSEGNKAKVTVRFRGREMAHKDLGFEMLGKIIKDSGDMAVVTSAPAMEGRLMYMVLAPSPKAMILKKAKDEEKAREKKAASESEES